MGGEVPGFLEAFGVIHAGDGILSTLIERRGAACVDVPDKRRGDVRYSMADIGLSAFSLFFMQSEWFLSRQRSLDDWSTLMQTLIGSKPPPEVETRIAP